MINNNEHIIILVDGRCNLCNKWVRFISKRDRKKKFRYASLQSSFAKKLLKKYNFKEFDLSTIIFVQKNKTYVKSSAIIKILLNLRFFYKMSILFYLIPKNIRDFIYTTVAKNRYKWFGKKEICSIPLKIDHHLFLDKDENIYQ